MNRDSRYRVERLTWSTDACHCASAGLDTLQRFFVYPFKWRQSSPTRRAAPNRISASKDQTLILILEGFRDQRSWGDVSQPST